MCIVEVHEMDVISISKTMKRKRIKSNEDKTFAFVVALNRAVLNRSTMSRFKIFLHVSHEEDLTVSFISL